MQINQLKINNFVCFEDATIKFNTLNYIIGQNNIGKTLSLQLIEQFFSNQQERYRFFNLEQFIDKKKPIELWLTFKNFNIKEIAAFEAYFSNLDSSNPQDIELILKIKVENHEDEIEINPFVIIDEMEEKNFAVYKRLLENYYFMLISSTNDVKATINLRNRKGIFTKILEKILDSSMKDELIAIIEKINLNLNKRGSIKEFNHKLKEKLRDLFEYDTRLAILDPSLEFGLSTEEKLLYNFQILLRQESKEFQPTEIGDGLKNFFINTLFQIYLESEYKSNSNSFSILIDEPEIHLHPHSQRYLISFWRNVIQELIGEDSENYQLIVSTHSSNIPFPTEESNYLFYHKSLNNMTTVNSKSIQQYKDKKLKKWILNTLQIFPDIIFARKIIIIEGKTDWWYIKYFSMKDERYDLNHKGISLRYVGSCSEIENAVEANNFFEKSIKVIIDDDKGDNSEIEARLKSKKVEVFKIDNAIESLIGKALTIPSLFKIIKDIAENQSQFSNVSKIISKIITYHNKKFDKQIDSFEMLEEIFNQYEKIDQIELVKLLRKGLISILSKNKTEYMCFVVGNIIVKEDIREEIRAILEFICKD
ncbi:hypothetical protein NEF87_004852 [Candidatus Lokiarchaeum ossiferum]|uniref:ATP-dependent endonuclease n=1 Tax=Candidatus Lokiarchaeum ossiferum TaxID=2951803 RepID=A0ABY6I0B8_9ARCH|nr:hypothetical protein NEF87_004852 [Candidatus Lokiarchaeum sp. B-35]